MSKKMVKFGIGKFLVMALMLGGGLVYGTQMVQKNQENRSSAASMKVTQICICSKPVYKSKPLCEKAKGVWKCTQKVIKITPTMVPKVCSYSSCSACKTPTECTKVGCGWDTSVKACGTKAKTTTTYYYHNRARKSCIGVDLYNSIEKCKSGTNSTCYTNKPACDSANVCKYSGVTMSSGQSKCFNKKNGGSEMVECNGGKTTILSSYVDPNCTIDPVGSCRVGDILIVDGGNRCLNSYDYFTSKENMSAVIGCSNGKISILALFKNEGCTN